MADDMNKQQSNPADAGQDNSNTQTADNTQQQKTFTQEELERILSERLKREREKYKDYDELRKAAEEYKKIKEAQMSEQEKLQMRLAEIEREKLERERELAELKMSMTKQKVLSELGLPLSLADRVFGETEEEIRQDAEELKKLFGLQMQPKQVGSATNPAGGGNYGVDVDALSKMSMQEYIAWRNKQK